MLRLFLTCTLISMDGSAIFVKLEEQSVIGVILLLFGVSWVGFASVQPIPDYPFCVTGGIHLGHRPVGSLVLLLLPSTSSGLLRF